MRVPGDDFLILFGSIARRRPVHDYRWCIALQVLCDALLHLRRKRRHRAGYLVAAASSSKLTSDAPTRSSPDEMILTRVPRSSTVSS